MGPLLTNNFRNCYMLTEQEMSELLADKAIWETTYVDKRKANRALFDRLFILSAQDWCNRSEELTIATKIRRQLAMDVIVDFKLCNVQGFESKLIANTFGNYVWNVNDVHTLFVHFIHYSNQQDFINILLNCMVVSTLTTNATPLSVHGLYITNACNDLINRSQILATQYAPEHTIYVDPLNGKEWLIKQLNYLDECMELLPHDYWSALLMRVLKTVVLAYAKQKSMFTLIDTHVTKLSINNLIGE